MLPAFTRSQNKTQRLFIQVMKLLVYNIISLNWFCKRECLIRRVGLEPTSSGHEPGMFPFTIPQKKTNIF